MAHRQPRVCAACGYWFIPGDSLRDVRTELGILYICVWCLDALHDSGVYCHDDELRTWRYFETHIWDETPYAETTFDVLIDATYERSCAMRKQYTGW